MTDAQLRGLLLDCLKLWAVRGTVAVRDDGLVIETVDGAFIITRAPADLRPVRWFYQTPERAAAGRTARAAPSIVALLSALRNAMAGAGGDRLRVGGG
ncbi:hypothetical protein [Rhodopila globiformis]|uniref:Uncharacterized protein n=1 Tax=Rhodopila globiformis TaxID=1071 RepID=A0A2S6MWG9_RHOGL|nr:hypothetical protein [Rhodopila globiformis]PPQ26701.1 hypothetical protein CCS01_29515 [Rhodopila globiformis]